MEQVQKENPGTTENGCLKSVTRYLCNTFGRFLIKLHLPVNEIQLKSKKV